MHSRIYDVYEAMKWFMIVCVFISANAMAKTTKEVFSVSKIIQDKKQFTELVEKTVLAGQVDSREKAYGLVDRATASLPANKHFKENPIYGELLFQTSKKPEALVGLFSIFLEKTKIVQFFLLLVGTLYLSHIMGEAKYFMKPFGFGRLFYGIFRFTAINSVRIGGFFYLFKANLAPFGRVMVDSVASVAVDYPVLVKASHLLNNVLSTSLGF